MKLKKGDQVIVITGKDKGRQSAITRVLHQKDKVFVDGVNMKKKAVRPNPNANEVGGIKEIEAALPVSNVAIFNPTTKKADRVGYKFLEDGRKVRIFKKTGEQIDI
ncbi:MAG: 50S ribosomal protein L24 [Gammaproteobacteria bacterium]|nr:50S ribosomal protein L24 [Gammaproteobacteria bacterium]